MECDDDKVQKTTRNSISNNDVVNVNSSRLEQKRKSEGHQLFVHDVNRGKWANKTEFLLSCISYAIGIGNVWRFPYLCYRSGGGAFLIPYLLMLFICGVPLFLMEIIIGQFSSTGVLGMFRMCPLFKGAGYTIILLNFYCICYYSVIITYPVIYLTRIFTKKLPWTDCNNPWNTPNCIAFHKDSPILQSNVTLKGFKTPSDEFFHIEILKISSGIQEVGTIVWPLLICLFIVWCITYICIHSGVKTVGKVVYFTAIFPYVILSILFVRGITLPGASKGIKFYLQPEWNKLLDLKVWADAAIQIFYSLGPGWGGIVNTASYNDFKNNAKLDGVIIPIINSSTSIFAGFVVFSVLGYLSEITGISVSEVATSGAGLAFVTYPQAISMLPFPQLWAALFFFMLFLLGLGSQFIQIEAIISTCLDECHSLRNHKKKVTFISCVILFFLSISMVTNGGIYILQLLDWYSASISVILVCIIEVGIVAYSYGAKRFANDVYFMLGKYPEKFWTISWQYTTPIVLMFIFATTILFNRNVSYNNNPYPSWAIAIGWCTCASSIACIPIYIIYLLCKSKGKTKDILKKYTKAFDWTPASPENRRLYENFRKEKDAEDQERKATQIQLDERRKKENKNRLYP
ncbi:sodium- and chloride-dependent glycine transporter 1-like [Condylostylus longicornis]|uniref:sodium- and chloride-dependent glycine transporter 1-like n=1 Tax=Condylostylus longicornis TaxID=2530218 RepID=UPI00244DB0BF|nr:sodium- and chloride-dependent glycine transporter 1-like [Condylostylus longicornis]